MSKNYYVYLLKSTKGTTYVGATVNLERRLRQHNKELVGGAKATTAKVKKGESIGATNLDGYDTTTFETRISAKNMKAGNLNMYNYLVNTGDANGNKFTAVP